MLQLFSAFSALGSGSGNSFWEERRSLQAAPVVPTEPPDTGVGPTAGQGTLHLTETGTQSRALTFPAANGIMQQHSFNVDGKREDQFDGFFVVFFFFQNALEGAEALQTPGRMMCLIVCFFICLFISAKEFWGFWLKEKTCLCPCLIGSGNKCTAWCCRAENATRSLTSSVQVGISCQIIPGKER